MTTDALRHFLERAVEVHATTLEHSFPRCFDWERLCRDAPSMAERKSDGQFDATDVVQAEALKQRAQVTFRLSHAVALAVICAANRDGDDPEADLDSFGRFPDDEEEERFEVLVSEVLGPVEEFLHDPETPLDERGVQAYQLQVLAWPHVQEALGAAAVFDASEHGDVPPAPVEARPLLVSIARVATILAALRWMAR